MAVSDELVDDDSDDAVQAMSRLTTTDRHSWNSKTGGVSSE